MKAIQISEYGPPAVMQLRDLPLPEPAKGQLRVRVCAASVGPWDALIRGGRSGIPQTLPLTPGSDISGTVDALDAEVTAFNVGDEAYGLTNAHFTGGYAEYALASNSSVTKKPNSLGFIEAASVPVVAVTAWQMLFEYAHVISRQSVLIQGAREASVPMRCRWLATPDSRSSRRPLSPISTTFAGWALRPSLITVTPALRTLYPP